MQGAKNNAYLPLQNVSTIKCTTGTFSNSLTLRNATVDCKGANFVDFALDSLLVDTVNERTLDHGVDVESVNIKDGLVDGVAISAFKIDYDSKINQALLTTSSPTFTGLTLTNLNGFGASSGFVKRASSGAISIDSTSYEEALTFSTGLTRTVNTITVNASQYITQLSNLASAGIVICDSKGNLSVDTSSYLTGVTLTGDVTGSGTGSIATTISALAVTNAMLAGSIAASKLVATDIITVGTIGTGTWQGSTISTLYGGTGQTTYSSGELLIGNASNGLTKATLTGTANQIDVTNGSGSITLSIPTTLYINDTRIRNIADPTKYATLTTDAAGRLAISAGYGGGVNNITTDCTNFSVYASSAGNVISSIGNSNTGGAMLSTLVQSGGTADPVVQYVVGAPAVATWTSGIDQSDSNKFKISASATLGTTDTLSITTAGVVTIPNLTVSSAINVTSLSASSLVATDGSKNLTSTVSGLSPGFTGLSLSGLTASTLVATDGSKNLTSSVTGLTPTFAGLITTGDRKTYNNFNSKYYSNAGTTQIGAVGVANTTTVFDMALVSTSGWLRIGAPSAGTISYWTDGNAGVNASPQFRMSGSTFGVYTSAGALNGTIAPSGSDFLITAAAGLRLYGTNGNVLISPNGTNYIWINNSQMFPHADNVYSNGLTSARWANVYSTLGNFSSTLSCADGSVGTPGINFGLDTNTGIYRISADNLGIACNGTKIIDVLSAGVTMPINPSFNAYVGSTVNDQTGDSTTYQLICGTEQHDVGSNYNAATGVFTAPVAGRYFLHGQVTVGGLLNTHVTGNAAFVLNSSSAIARTLTNPWAISTGGQTTIIVSTIYQLAASDTVYMNVQVTGGTKTVDIIQGQSVTFFCANLLS